MSFQIDWRLFFNAFTWRSRFLFQKLIILRSYKIDEPNPWDHKWEAGYMGYSLAAIETKIAAAGWRIIRRDFTSLTRSVSYLLDPKKSYGQT